MKNLKSEIEINRRKIGPSRPVYLIAELSANHNQDYSKAVEMIHAAKEAGADAIKLQTYTADTLTIDSNQSCFRIKGGTSWDGKTLHDLYQQAYMPWDWQPKLKKVANRLGIDLFSTAFDFSSIDFLEKMAVPVHKIASFEIVDIPLIQKVAATRKPLILSTGMSSLNEIQEACQAAIRSGSQQIALLKCTSAYPARPSDMNLRSIPFLMNKFRIPIGLSDHTMGIQTAIASVALGACIIEKHFTLSRKYTSADSHFSLEPREFKALHDGVREIEQALGRPILGISKNEASSRAFRRSLFAVQDIEKGECLTHQNVRSIRPGNGLMPKYLNQIIGRKALKKIARGTPLKWSLFR